jgi:hypothetical protein
MKRLNLTVAAFALPLLAVCALSARALDRPDPRSERLAARSSASGELPRAAPSAAPGPSLTVAPHADHASSERKPETGAHVDLSLTPVASDAVRVTVTLAAQRATSPGVLRVRVDDGALVEGEAEWLLDALPAGATVNRSVTVRRGIEAAHGVFIGVGFSVDSAGGTVSTSAGVWAFGEPDPTRVLPRSGAELGEDGVGALGPGERVVRTPSGERLHEVVVP